MASVSYGESSRPVATTVDDRDWPHTTRLHPWLAAALMFVVFLVPTDSTVYPISLPFDARPDRLLLIACVGLGLLALSVRPRGITPIRHRYGAIEVWIFVFFAAVIASVVFNLPHLQDLNELQGAIKRFIALSTFFLFYFVLVNSIRPTEVPAFVRLTVAIGTVAALGTIYQYFSHFNIFYYVNSVLSPPGTRLRNYESITAPGGRPDITGPTSHGLALSTMLAMIVPFAVVGAVNAAQRRDRWIYAVCAVIIFFGCVSTLRRSGVILPFIATSVVILLGGRKMLPAAATFVVLLVVTPIVAPGVVADVRYQFSSQNTINQQSTSGRTSDYSAVGPDIRAHALVGRGYGSYSAARYRFLDNQWLGALITIGVVGAGAYLALMLAGITSAWRLVRSPSAFGGWIGLASVGSILAYVAANGLFDTLAFSQAPYAFLLVLAFVSVLRRDRLPGRGAIVRSGDSKPFL